ncbi:arabinofuranosidase catalytic domain-containing protein [Plantactinospora solaniradicis]|uniref:Arabinofuranosidase catalytic domain-containing protein n=1 Tax=Plantactinospora solaniradicis TaxID=1723736 RepID=A0ABW1KKB7_9ACTN
MDAGDAQLPGRRDLRPPLDLHHGPGKQGAIILGGDGDCCESDGDVNLSAGTFYEGAMVAGHPSDATENAVRANVVSAGYR